MKNAITATLIIIGFIVGLCALDIRDQRRKQRRLPEQEPSRDRGKPHANQGRHNSQRNIVSAIYAALDEHKSAGVYQRGHQRAQTTIAALTLIVVGAYTLVTYLELLDLGRANQISNDTLIATSRPWVSIKTLELADPLVIDGSGAKIRIIFRLINGGRSPARFPLIDGTFYVWDIVASEMFPPIVVKEVCSKTRKRVQGGGTTLFPDHEIPQPHFFQMTKMELDKWRSLMQLVIKSRR